MPAASSNALEFQPPQGRLLATVFTVSSILVTLLWHTMFPFRKLDLWIWFVCCGVVLLSVSRFSMRHAVPLPEIGLFSFPFLFDFFFQKICPTAKVASLDEVLWCFDANFGYPQPALGRLLVEYPLLFWTCKLTWSALPLLFVVIYLALPFERRRQYVVALIATGSLILPLYALCPGAGPVYLFRDYYPYPNSLPMPLLNPQRVHLPAGLLLNTTPSGHMAWALLLFGFALKFCSRRVSIVFGVLVGLTVLSTLGLGEHYVVDLILSVPYAAAVWSLVNRKWVASGFLLAILVVWLLALREAWALALPMPVVLALSVATVAGSLATAWGGPSGRRTAFQAVLPIERGC